MKIVRTISKCFFWIFLIGLNGLSENILANENIQHNILDGECYEGKIRATGFWGLFSVKGTLSFSDGALFWTVKYTVDKCPYSIYETGSQTRFKSKMIFDSGDSVEWDGHYDGSMIHDVTAEWIRVEGDFIHDLLLPDVVTLVFTPKKKCSGKRKTG